MRGFIAHPCTITRLYEKSIAAQSQSYKFYIIYLLLYLYVVLCVSFRYVSYYDAEDRCLHRQ